METCYEPSHQHTHSVKVTMMKQMIDPGLKIIRQIIDSNTL